MSSTISANVSYVPSYAPSLHSQAQAWTIDKVVCWTLVVAVVFLNGADFRGDTGEEFAVHWQIYLRLLVAFLCGCVGLLYFLPKTFRDFLTWPGLLASAYVGWYGITLATAVEKSYCTAAWISLVGVMLMIPAAMRTLGATRFLNALATGLVVYLVGSWIAYLFFPQVGVFHEQITETLVYQRMGGLGHPNELGFVAAFTVLVFAGLAVSRKLSWSIASLGILLGAFTLYSCFSRTAMIACSIGLMVTLQPVLRRPGNAFAIFFGLAALTFVAFVSLGLGKLDWFAQSAVMNLTKSGSVEELATLTGRTEIWAYGIEQIQASPIVGYGYCSARFVMETHSYHCHNVVLNAFLFGGILSGFIVIAMIAQLIISAYYVPRPEIDGLSFCIVVAGMVDGILGAPSPSATVLIWFTLLFWRQLDMRVATPRIEDASRGSILSMGNEPQPEMS